MMRQSRQVTPQCMRRAMRIATRLGRLRLRRNATALLLFCAASISVAAQQRNPVAELMPAGTTATYTASSSARATTQQLRATSLAPDTRNGQRFTLNFDVNSAAVCLDDRRRNSVATACPVLSAALFVTFELQGPAN
jgi:hypothetical protein